MKHFIRSLATAVILTLSLTTPVLARAATPTGNDVSWPQCGKKLPTGQAFGIVGVTGGLANNTNPCLQEQLTWANTSTGTTSQDKVQLYVNTANPGLTGSWWPTSNQGVTNPYGTCTGSDTPSCAYIYGYQKALDDATIRGITNPSAYRWWLDVETINSWESNKTANQADLEGMTAYFRSINAEVGLYSTSYQWNLLIGAPNTNSNLYGLPSWIPGARSLQAAQKNCTLPGLTGGPTVLTQYISKNLDYDYSC